MTACDLLAAELALDRLEATVATELPAHVRAFAAAHAAGRPAPAAPASLLRPDALVIARQALAHPLLADRALAMVRLLAPIAIDLDARVVTARAATPSWAAYDRLAAARDVAAHDRFGIGFLELVHRLHGTREPVTASAWPQVIAGWTEPLADAPPPLADALDLPRGVTVVSSAVARPRAFVVEPRREVIVVVPVPRTPADQFATAHELGHAFAALLVGVIPRVVDEAVASYTARVLEAPGPWFLPLASAARVRRVALARVLDGIERGQGDRVPADPPWALWHDPGAQATYVAAEALADHWVATLGPDALASAIRSAASEVDRVTVLA
ncbi:MAG: hypothetical protein WKG01_29010 [Kofleriaceae bacterium]